MDELREKIVAIYRAHDEQDNPRDFADAILGLPEIAEGLREVALRKRVEDRLAGIADERKFVA